ncbi:MAG TPA: GNAT family N-acetyltransferase [Candidatus Baltobacteraceae bacterium]|jgi:ribosomal protein S18 acetylase RimI-like enzyme|nr:GNAT family N-acetyltransferase [Candidatus Baltobacteraceae bacterium]
MRTTEYRVIAARPEDRARAVPLLSEYLRTVEEFEDDQQTALELQPLLDRSAGALWLALAQSNEAEAVGCVALRELDQPRAFEIKRLYVRPEARGYGIARELLRMAEEAARNQGAREIYLDTKNGMEAAVRLYESEGYSRTQAYRENLCGDIFMRKFLEP